MTDYMQKALELLGSGDGQLNIARTLEALDTANTRADAAEKRERELREAAAKAAKRALAVFDANDLAEPGPRGLLNALIQPEPDPLVDQISALLTQTRPAMVASHAKLSSVSPPS